MGPWGYSRAVGGVRTLPIATNHSIRLLILGSTSRGIPRKKWEIPIPTAVLPTYCFYPGADVIAFIELLRVYVHSSLEAMFELTPT